MKQAPEKVIVPLPESLINKAKACEEVIIYERGELRQSLSQQSIRPLVSNTNGSSVSQGSTKGQGIVQQR
jgi:hypothetical protein